MQNVNVLPTADAGANQSPDEGAPVTLTGLGSTDSDGTIASYAWSQTVGTLVVLDETVPAQPTFTFETASYPTAPLVSYQINRQLSGWHLPPLVFRAFGAHLPFLAKSGSYGL